MTIEVEIRTTGHVFKKNGDELVIDDAVLASVKKYILDKMFRELDAAILDPDFGNPNIIRNGKSRPVPPLLGTGDEDA